MRILIASIQVPFIKGGATYLAEGLLNELKKYRHEVELVTTPFKFHSDRYIDHVIDFWSVQDFNNFNFCSIDKVIALQFPAYYVNHIDKVVWLIHQHRAVYELYNEENSSDDLKRLRHRIQKLDNERLSQASELFTISKTVTKRLKRFNNMDSIPLYHPPFGENNFYCEEPYSYIFYPSRFETLKRQDLLIKAIKHTKTPVKAIIAGDGGQKPVYEQLIEELDVKNKVELLGTVSEDEKYSLFAKSLAVFFAPFDEDYGYVTLEAMLSSKPVITCNDSGGPLEFIVNGVNGFILDPDPELIAKKIDWFYSNRQRAKEMGKKGLEIYKSKNLSWENVVNKLLGK